MFRLPDIPKGFTFSENTRSLVCDRCKQEYRFDSTDHVGGIDGEAVCFAADAACKCPNIADGCLYCGENAVGRWFVPRVLGVPPCEVESVDYSFDPPVYRGRDGSGATWSWDIEGLHADMRPETLEERTTRLRKEVHAPETGRHAQFPGWTTTVRDDAVRWSQDDSDNYVEVPIWNLRDEMSGVREFVHVNSSTYIAAGLRLQVGDVLYDRDDPAGDLAVVKEARGDAVVLTTDGNDSGLFDHDELRRRFRLLPPAFRPAGLVAFKARAGEPVTVLTPEVQQAVEESLRHFAKFCWQQAIVAMLRKLCAGTELAAEAVRAFGEQAEEANALLTRDHSERLRAGVEEAEARRRDREPRVIVEPDYPEDWWPE